MAHRLAWLYVYGVWPEGLIDHRNGDRRDNRIANLRDASFSLNSQNQRAAHVDSTTRLLGVRVNGKRFQARIYKGGRTVSLGNFQTAEAAHAAYVSAKRQMHEGCTL